MKTTPRKAKTNHGYSRARIPHHPTHRSSLIARRSSLTPDHCPTSRSSSQTSVGCSRRARWQSGPAGHSAGTAPGTSSHRGFCTRGNRRWRTGRTAEEMGGHRASPHPAPSHPHPATRADYPGPAWCPASQGFQRCLGLGSRFGYRFGHRAWACKRFGILL
jgi:hypothetical protein